jgi:hypothetical protein
MSHHKEKEVGMLIIRREGYAWAERAVRIARSEDGAYWWVNPATQVMRATGCGVSRYNCIQSFAQGLKDAGHKVVIDDRRQGVRLKAGEFTGIDTVTCVYWLVGFAWGQGKWEDLIAALQRDVRQDRWLEVLEITARYFMGHPWQKLRVILPTLL